MSVMAGLILMLAPLTTATASFDLRHADRDLWPVAGMRDDRLPVRFTDDLRRPRRSPYQLPNVSAIEDRAEPARFRVRGRKVKLRVPIGAGS